MPPPIRRFSPARGIIADVNERSITITGRAQVYGPSASAVVATQMSAALNNGWSRVFSDGYSSRCTVTVTYRGPGTPEDSTVLQIEYSPSIERSEATRGGGLGAETIWLSSNDSNAISWVLVHEFGHTLGMDDRYTDEVRTINGTKKTVSVPHATYDGELMAQQNTQLSSRTLQDLNTETAPSENWINDDDQVRDWITQHSRADLAAVSTAGKIGALRTLMGGWISDEDVVAMEQIIGAVRNRDEAAAIRSAIRLLDMTSIGQRTRIRVALSRMPS
jgi:hypothetical protein